jgi:hypothetical protein
MELIMADKKPFDIEKFNSDPSYETERNTFDAMFESSFKRFTEKHKKVEPESENIFDVIFGSKKGGE